MSTFLLTWNPARWPWVNLAEVSQQTGNGMPYDYRWSTGNTKKITRGDRVFLLKQGEGPKGIFAAGWVTSDQVYAAPHYDARRAADGDTALRADVRFERILNPAETSPLSVDDISHGPLAKVYWKTPASGMELADDAAAELEALWARHLKGIDGPGRLSANDADDQATAFSPQDRDERAIVLRQIKARRGQQTFRDSLRARYGERCMISGCALMDVVEAAHIKPYRGDVDNHPENGLLLRADLHTLFDLDLIGIEPDTLIVRLHENAKQGGYERFDGTKLQCHTATPSREALALRWESFCRRRLLG